MAEIVNLRAARKQKARADRERVADENRTRFGRTKVDKDAARNEERRKASHLDGHRLDLPEPDK